MKLISKYQYGAFINSLPKNQQPTSDFNVYRYWELNGKPANFLQAIAKGMYVFNPFDGRFHATSVAYNKDTDEYEFMKTWDHPTIDYELLWYFNNPESSDFKKTYGLDMDSTPYKYINRSKTNKKLL